MKVIKRDGTTVTFDGSKIILAIQKANAAVDESERVDNPSIEELAKFVEGKNQDRLLVENIQDMVERKLMDLGKFSLAKATTTVLFEAPVKNVEALIITLL